MLSSIDKHAVRFFRDRCAAELAATFDTDPPTYTVPVVTGHFRHPCPQRNLRSTALQVDEVYRLSPAFDVHTAPSYVHVQDSSDPATPVVPPGIQVVLTRVPAALFGFIYRAGRCRFCGQSARSREHRLVLAHQRPPLRGRGQGAEHGRGET